MKNTTKNTKTTKTVKAALGVSAALLVAVAVGSSAYADGYGKHHGKGQGQNRGGIAPIFMNGADVNDDKAVTLAEVNARIDTFFTEVDADKNSVLSKTELETGLKAKAEERRAKRMEANDGEQKMGKRFSEKHKGMKDGSRGAKHLERLIERVDVNGDGEVAKSEVQDRMEKTFAFLDINADGKLEGNELRKGKFRGEGRHGKGHGKGHGDRGHGHRN